MVVKVVGKQHLEGISKKSGKPYSNTVVYILNSKNGVEGQEASSVWLDDKQFPVTNVVLNQDYSIEYDRGGYVVDFRPLSAGK